MHETTLSLDDAIDQPIRRRAEASGKTRASIIREAPAAFPGESAPRPSSIGLGNSGAGDLSERAEELLAAMGES